MSSPAKSPMLEQQQSTDPEWLQRLAASLVAIIALLVGWIAKIKRGIAAGPGISEKRALTLIREEIAEEERWRAFENRLERIERILDHRSTP